MATADVTLRRTRTSDSRNSFFELERNGKIISEVHIALIDSRNNVIMHKLAVSLEDKQVARNVLNRLTHEDRDLISYPHSFSSLDKIRLMRDDFTTIQFSDISTEVDTTVRFTWHQEYDGLYETAEQTVQAACDELLTRHNLHIKAEYAKVNKFENLEVKLSIMDEGKEFCFWLALHWPPLPGMFDLDIIPAYHPCRNGRKSGSMINGCTDAYLDHNKGNIERIFPPSTSINSGTDVLGRWGKMKHPLYEKGKDFGIVIDPFVFRTKESKDAIVKLVLDALNMNETYICVSGGFRSDLDLPSNVLQQYKKRLSKKERRRNRDVLPEQARGSESRCVTIYRQLENEGQLKDAYIPEWFFREGWLDMYR